MKYINVLALTLAASLLTACAGPKTSGARVEQVENSDEFTIDYHNTGMATELRIELMQLNRRNDFLNAQVTVESLSDRDKIYQYKFVWMDADGMLVAPNASTWQPLIMHGRERKQLQAVAIETRADRVQFQIRRAYK